MTDESELRTMYTEAVVNMIYSTIPEFIWLY
jgi:hypothetical protein